MEIAFADGPVIGALPFLVVMVMSYRRSRHLSRYPIWRSLSIAVAAGVFWPVWLVASVVNRDQLAQDWSQYRAERDGASTDPRASAG